MNPYLNDSIRSVIKKMLYESWEIKEGEKILIISDYPNAEESVSKPSNLISSMLNRNMLAKKIYDIIQELEPGSVELYFMKATYQHYQNPIDKRMRERIEQSDIVFTLTEFSLTDVEIFEDLLANNEIRHVSAPLVPPEVFLPGGPLDIDYNLMEKITSRLFSLVKDAKKIELFDVAGSHLTLDFDPPARWLFESGFSNKKGVFSNIPAGAVTLILSYKEEKCRINGCLNIFPGWIEDLTNQLTITLRDTRLINAHGGGKAGERLRNLMNTEEIRVNQLGIGTNPNAKDPLCKTVADKFLSIVHVCFAPDEMIEHYYFPLSKMRINDKEYRYHDLFEI